MRYTNINIGDAGNTFNYIIGYIEGSDIDQACIKYFFNTENDYSFYYTQTNEYSSMIRIGDEWVDDNDSIIKREIITSVKKSTLRVFFPPYSLDTYNRGVNYVLDIYTWINGRKLILGSYRFSRLNAISTTPTRFLDETYMECVDIDILDPWYITYSDEWASFRQNQLGETPSTNDTGSQLYISLHPIENSNENWVKFGDYDGGQNSINISLDESDYFCLDLTHNINETCSNPRFICKLKFNSIYDNLDEYILETYGITNPSYTYELVVKDNDNVYTDPIKVTLNNGEIYVDNGVEYKDGEVMFNIHFDNWSGYVEGMFVVASFSISDSEQELLFIKSNEIPLTQQLFSYFVGNKMINYINLNENNLLNMKLYKIDAVNKTEVKTIQMDRPNDAKSNIIQPIFFKTRDLANIVVHPAVTEYIAINLDSYKSQVNRFIIQIEGCAFAEVARNNSGVIFKIVGNKLPNQTTEGVYYILNQDAELVTNGKYKYDI